MSFTDLLQLLVNWYNKMSLHDLIEIISGIAVLIGSLVALRGINTWRREFRVKRDVPLAEEVLALFYQAGDAIRYIRHIYAHGDEGKSRQATEEEDEETKKARDKAYVVVERYQKHQEIFNKLQSLRYSFMVRFGPEKGRLFNEIPSILNPNQVSRK